MERRREAWHNEETPATRGQACHHALTMSIAAARISISLLCSLCLIRGRITNAKMPRTSPPTLSMMPNLADPQPNSCPTNSEGAAPVRQGALIDVAWP